MNKSSDATLKMYVDIFEPITTDQIVRSSSYGMFVYVDERADSFIMSLLKDLSIWSSYTKTITTKNDICYYGFEIPYSDNTFVLSSCFISLCRKHNVDLISDSEKYTVFMQEEVVLFQ